MSELSAPRVLVACPTYDGMKYCLQEWADAYHAFTYPNKGALQVDNSDKDLHYLHVIRSLGIQAIYQPRRFAFLWDTLEIGWRTIVEYAHDEGYDLICSIEADVIGPPETLDVLVEAWQLKGPKAVVAHRYHPRGIDNPVPPEGMVIDQEKYEEVQKEHWFDTLGCTLFPTELMYETRNEWKAIFEVELYIIANQKGYERVRLKDLLKLRHLDNVPKKEDPKEQWKVNLDRLGPAELIVHKAEDISESPELAERLSRSIGDDGTFYPYHSREEAQDDKPPQGLARLTGPLPDDELKPGAGEYDPHRHSPTGLHGRRDHQFNPQYAPKILTPQELRDQIKEQVLSQRSDPDELEKENNQLRLVCNALFGEVERLRNVDRSKERPNLIEQWNAQAKVG